MEQERMLEQLSDQEILRSFGTGEDPTTRGFDDATYARVLAHELVRARSRVNYYRTLYTTFVEAGKPFLIENLADAEEGNAVPVKVAFTDDPQQVRELEDNPVVEVWTEPELLEALLRERMVQDFFTELLEELEPAVLNSNSTHG